MSGALYMILAMSAAGVQFGWQPIDGGGREYIVQVEPQLVDTFRKDGFTSDVPPDLRDIRRIRIVVGNGPLPNQGAMSAAQEPSKLAATTTKSDAGPRATTAAKVPSGVAADWPPLPGPAETRDPQPGAAPPLVPVPQVPTAAPDATKPPSLPADSPKIDTHPRTAEKPSTDAPPPDPTPDPRQAQTWPNSLQAPRDNGWPPRHQPTTDANGQPLTTVGDQRRSPSEENPPVGLAADGPHPWGILLGVSALLVASVAGNVFLGWGFLGARARYLEVLDELEGHSHVIDTDEEAAAKPADDDDDEDDEREEAAVAAPGKATKPAQSKK